MKTKLLVSLFFIMVILMGPLSLVKAGEWGGGIGTGLFGLNVEGNVGLNTKLLGPVEFKDISLDPSDLSNFIESAFGFGGYFSDGKWLIDYSMVYLKLGDETSSRLVKSAKFEYETFGFEALVGYPVYSSPSFIMRVHGGIRYTSQEISTGLTIGATNISRNIDNDWADALVGVSADVIFNEKWSWNNRVIAGYGGSEGTYSAQTGVTWKFHKHWSTKLFGKYTAVEFEEGNKGDTNWYLYDVDEFGAGLTILYQW